MDTVFQYSEAMPLSARVGVLLCVTTWVAGLGSLFIFKAKRDGVPLMSYVPMRVSHFRMLDTYEGIAIGILAAFLISASSWFLGM